MANKPAPRNWNDVQTVLATMAMALSLGLWNLFAGPDRALAKDNSQTALAPPPVPPTEQPNLAPTPLPQIKIMLGGAAPQPVNQPAGPATANQPTAHRRNHNNDPVAAPSGGGGGGNTNPPPAQPPGGGGGGGGGGTGGS